MKRNIDAQQSSDLWHLSDTAPSLEIYANANFDTSDGQRILAGDPQLQNFYRAVTCSVVDGRLVVPTIEDIDTTEDSPDNQRATYSAYLRANGQQLIDYLLNFTIPPSTTTPVSSISWITLRIHTGGIMQRDPLLTYTRQEILALIETEVQIAVGTLNFASSIVAGRSFLDVNPALPSVPTAIGLNSRRVAEMYNVKATAIGAIGDGTTNDRAALNTLANTTLQISGAGGDIYFPAGIYLIGSNMTFPANVRLVFDPRAMLKVATGVTVIIAGVIDAAPYQIFTNATAGLGTVSFSGNTKVRDVYAEYWGASPSASAAVNAAALNAANAALVSITAGTGSAGTILLGGSGTYDFNATVNLGSDAAAFTGIGLAGTNGVVGTTLNWTGSTSGTAIYLTRGRYNNLRDFKLTSSVAKGTTTGLRISGPAAGTNTSGVTLTRVVASGFHIGGLVGDGAAGGFDASEISGFGGSFESNDIGFRVDGSNSLNVNFYNTGFDSNTTYGIDANSGGVNVFGGAMGRNGKDIKQTQAGQVVMIGVRTESNVIFDSSAAGGSTSLSLIGVTQAIADDFTVSAATNANPIAVTTSAVHGLATGDRVFIRNAAGNTAANGPWAIIVTSTTEFTLTGSVGNGVYSGSGTGFSDHNPVKLNTGCQATIDGCTLRGSVSLSNGSNGVSVTIRNSTTPFVSPLDVSDGNGTLAYYTLDHTRRVDADYATVATFNESGRVIGTTLVPGITNKGLGAAVASATAIIPSGSVFHVTGTITITSITATNVGAGAEITLIFDDVLTFTDGNNLKLAGNFVTTADDTITLRYDGTNFYEVCRSAN